MCIRDRYYYAFCRNFGIENSAATEDLRIGLGTCLLYTSDAADERCRQRNPSSLTTGEAPAPLARQVGELHLA